tara:strand:- start:187 stop:735 length:549 start_codon:yes stop_codon:yes gene_type:complete
MAAIAAGVGVMVMCSSSLAAAMMMGGSEDDAAAAGAGAGATTPVDKEFIYEFIVNVQHETSIGHHINDFLIDGVKPPVGSVVLYHPPDRGQNGGRAPPSSHLWDGDNTTGVAYNDPQPVGDVFMTVTLNQPERPKKFTIVYGRPLYAPGWIIKENGVAIITETENRGGDSEPTPIAYDYVLP